MALALPLIATLFAPVHSAVEWLSGAPASTAADGPAADTTSASASSASASSVSSALLISQRRSANASEPPLHGTAGAATARARPPVHARAGSASGRSLRRWSGPTRTPAGAQSAVRVVRIDETRSAQTGAAGRIVISGRLADVCAELDRLVALETAN